MAINKISNAQLPAHMSVGDLTIGPSASNSTLVCDGSMVISDAHSGYATLDVTACSNIDGLDPFIAVAMGRVMGPSDRGRIVASEKPEAALRYAKLVDEKSHPVTYGAVCKTKWQKEYEDYFRIIPDLYKDI